MSMTSEAERTHDIIEQATWSKPPGLRYKCCNCEPLAQITPHWILKLCESTCKWRSVTSQALMIQLGLTLTRAISVTSSTHRLLCTPNIDSGLVQQFKTLATTPITPVCDSNHSSHILQPLAYCHNPSKLVAIFKQGIDCRACGCIKTL